MSLEIFGIGDQFTTKEAFELLNSHVVKKEDEDNENLAIDKIGFIAGVITLNDEVEVMVKFPKEIIQLTEIQFSQRILLLEMS